MERMIHRAKAANCGALVLTLDLQMMGQRHKDIKNGLTEPRPSPRWPTDQPRHQAPLVPGHGGHAPAQLRQPGRACEGRVRHELPGRRGPTSSSTRACPGATWRWVKEQWGGKLILKGIMEVEDAVLAAHHGADAICGQQPRRAPARRRPFIDCGAARRLSMPWATSWRCGWMAASAAVRTCSKPGRWAHAAP